MQGRDALEFHENLFLGDLDLPEALIALGGEAAIHYPPQALGESWRRGFLAHLEALDRSGHDWRLVLVMEAPDIPVEPETARLLMYSWVLEPAFTRFLHREAWLDGDVAMCITRGSSRTAPPGRC